MNFNSGLLVIEPSEKIYNQAINIFNETPGFDQEIIRK
jgi:alpha-N-acetylglucosamine transferase